MVVTAGSINRNGEEDIVTAKLKKKEKCGSKYPVRLFGSAVHVLNLLCTRSLNDAGILDRLQETSFPVRLNL
jgi:hypothetical protein